MQDPVPPGALHPNIARIAAAYDQIIEQMGRNQLTATQARAKIDQLEARDDQGVRWSIDADTGQFVRKTISGDTAFDTPPVVGFATDDAFSYSTTRGSEIDPNQRLAMFSAPSEQLVKAPVDLTGATRNGPGTGNRGASGFSELVDSIPTVYKYAALAALLLVVAYFLLG